MFKQLTGAVRRLFSPATGEVVTVNKDELKQTQSAAAVMSVRSPSAGISVASTLSPGRLAGILRNAADGHARDFFIMAEELEERDLHYRREPLQGVMGVRG